MDIAGQDRFEGATRGAPGRAEAPRNGQTACLLLIEASDFTRLRRVLGVQRADLLAVDIAERVATVLPDARVSTAGRNLIEVAFAGDEADAAARAAAAVHEAFAAALLLDGEPNQVNLTIGAACAQDDMTLIERAEAALATARANVPATPVPQEEIDGDLAIAVVRDELFLQYQPKLHLRRQEIVSVEALIRWSHPRRGLVLPNDFIPAAERSGVIAAMTLWTVRQVIADQRVLFRNGFRLPVYINMAGVLLSDAAFIDEVITLIVDSGVKIGVEITETSVIDDPQGAIRHLQRLSDVGVAITIDDYGAGLSSLAYLKQLPATELKIDKLFVTQLTSTHRDPLIVRSTIDLAHALEMEVVAEGVETPASLALLSVMGCDMVQGFLISRPLALEALLAFLRDDKHLAVASPLQSSRERLAAVRARG